MPEPVTDADLARWEADAWEEIREYDTGSGSQRVALIAEVRRLRAIESAHQVVRVPEF
jgi:hypothetical protein